MSNGTARRTRGLVVAALLCWSGAAHAQRVAWDGFELDPPGVTPEALEPGEEIPYLKPLPGLRVEEGRLDESSPEAMSTPRTVYGFFVGPPVLRLVYAPVHVGRARGRITIGEALNAYRRALANVGWEVSVGTAGTVAHYARMGRDVWVKLQGGQGRLLITLCDVGANADASRLRTELERHGHVAVYGIYFDFDKDRLRPASEATLLQILRLLREEPALKIEIQGHTDNRIDHSRGRRLSDLRAASVASWLVKHGIDGHRLTHKGFEDSVPLMDNATPEGRARNRRLELVKIP